MRSTSNKSAPGRICQRSSTRWIPQSWAWKRSGKLSKRQYAHRSHGWKWFSKEMSCSSWARWWKSHATRDWWFEEATPSSTTEVSPSSSDVSSNDEEDIIYRQQSRTPPSESFSCEEEHLHQKKRRSPSHKGVGTDVIKKALSQISKSPFTRGIEKAKLPRQFHQPTFAMYNDRTDPVEHVSQFKQKMTVHSQDEALMCRVFPSSLGPMPMRWFDGLRINSINSFKKLT